MLARLISEIRQCGAREGFRMWWGVSSSDEQLIVCFLVLDFGLLVLWSALLSVWLKNISGDVATDGFFGWFLILLFPVLNVLFLTALIRGFRGAFRWLSGTVTWAFDVKREPFSLSIWRPYWVLLLGVCVYLTVWHRPWGLFASFCVAGVFTIVYLLLHVGGSYGSGIPAERIMLAQGHHPIGFSCLGSRRCRGSQRS